MIGQNELALALRTAWKSGDVSWLGLAKIAIDKLKPMTHLGPPIATTVCFTVTEDGALVPHFSFLKGTSADEAIAIVRRMHQALGTNLDQAHRCPLHKAA